MKAVKWLLAIVLTFSATQSIAESCKVYNSKQALTCLTSLANETHGEGELPNSIGITRQKAGFLAFKALLNESGITGSKKKKVLKTLKKAAYVATVMVHFDEDEIHYYAINRGKKVTPKKILSISLVDVSYDYPRTLTKDPGLFALALTDIEDWHYDQLADAADEVEEQPNKGFYTATVKSGEEVKWLAGLNEDAFNYSSQEDAQAGVKFCTVLSLKEVCSELKAFVAEAQAQYSDGGHSTIENLKCRKRGKTVYASYKLSHDWGDEFNVKRKIKACPAAL